MSREQALNMVKKLGISKECINEVSQKFSNYVMEILLFSRLQNNHERYGRPSWQRLAEAVQSLDYGLFEEIARNHGGEIVQLLNRN